MDDKGYNYPNPERPQKKNNLQQLYTSNVFAYYVKYPKRIDKRRNESLA